MQHTEIIDGVEIVKHTPDFIFYSIAILVSIISLLLYFLPSIIAFKRKHSSCYGILIINIFFGFTFFGWVIALAWSVSKKD